ncbi:hypothetical protein FGIG_06102 [Fasciola gigantica]|uniref:Uncharacterized protein n=1 Tax=Fasciola gigantica TaxID=46835 RepID=A0A504Z459_FASGI|nr:hypothetical protein FGIG_06102 [Fasciola gigantica]
MAAAEKCIKLLLDPPYSWNPNILDGDGNCPIHYLTKANVPSVFYLMWERSEKSYRPPAYRDRPFCWLIWPQNMGIFVSPESRLLFHLHEVLPLLGLRVTSLLIVSSTRINWFYLTNKITRWVLLDEQTRQVIPSCLCTDCGFLLRIRPSKSYLALNTSM